MTSTVVELMIEAEIFWDGLGAKIRKKKQCSSSILMLLSTNLPLL